MSSSIALLAQIRSGRVTERAAAAGGDLGGGNSASLSGPALRSVHVSTAGLAVESSLGPASPLTKPASGSESPPEVVQSGAPVAAAGFWFSPPRRRPAQAGEAADAKEEGAAGGDKFEGQRSTSAWLPTAAQQTAMPIGHMGGTSSGSVAPQSHSLTSGAVAGHEVAEADEAEEDWMADALV